MAGPPDTGIDPTWASAGSSLPSGRTVVAASAATTVILVLLVLAVVHRLVPITGADQR